ncbi:MAG: GGDEF domain-containing protein [Alphaproteobacteria bacterium]|nr:MAG: GGDEF domain-containing protein [Alphaproteobacteria bacterium]
MAGDKVQALNSSILAQAWPQGAGQNRVADLGDALALIAAQQRRITYLESLALTDELTGVFNRRGLTRALQRELAAAMRDQCGGGVLILYDLDGFKRINDRYGHQAGDAYLQAFASVLLAEVRPSDIVARLGGDEFAVILTRTPARIGQARAKLLTESLNSKSMSWRRSCLPLRASFGTTSYRKGDLVDAVLASADLKLYSNKQKRKGG